MNRHVMKHKKYPTTVFTALLVLLGSYSEHHRLLALDWAIVFLLAVYACVSMKRR